jgi:DNA polymerase/3'-5' exonuclease PolX
MKRAERPDERREGHVVDLTQEPEEMMAERQLHPPVVQAEVPDVQPRGLLIFLLFSTSFSSSSFFFAETKPFLEGCRFYFLQIRGLQRKVFEEKVPKYGGEISDVLDESVTQIITGYETYEKAMEGIRTNKLIAVSRDEHNKPRPIRANIHLAEWLTHALGKKIRLSNAEYRLNPPNRGNACGNTRDSVPPVAEEAVLQQNQPVVGEPNSLHAESPAKFEPQKQDAVLVRFTNDRPSPPCHCGLVTECHFNPSATSSLKGRIFFRCPVRNGDKRGCDFFEWVDDNPREDYAETFRKYGYEYEKFLKLPRIRFKASQPAEEQRCFGKRREVEPEVAPVASEVVLLKYVDEGECPSMCKCCICLTPMVDPCTTIACKHSFCRGCISAWLLTSSTCPECRSTVTLAGLREADMTLREVLNRLNVFCPNKDCVWQGQRGHLDAHRRRCVTHDSSDEGKESKEKRRKIDPSAPPPIFRAISGEATDAEGRFIVDNGRVANLNAGHLYRLSDVAPADKVALSKDEDEEEKGEGDSFADSDEEVARENSLSSARVFSHYSPPSDEDEGFEFDEEGARDSKFQYMAKEDVKLTPFLARNKKKFAIANPNAFEQRKNNNLNKELVDQLNKVAEMYEEHSFGRSAHVKAAAYVASHPRKIDSVEEARTVNGVGTGILRKIVEFLSFGEMAKLRNKDDDTCNREELQHIHGLGPSGLNILWCKGIRSVAQLRENTHLLTPTQLIGLRWVCFAGVFVRGLLKKKKNRYLEEFRQRIPRAEVAEIEDVVRRIAHRFDSKLILITCGSYRRGKATSGDVDILITHELFAKSMDMLLADLVKALTDAGIVTESLTTPKLGSDKWMGVCQLRKDLPHRRIDFQLIARDEWAFALLYFTGSEHCNRSMRFWAGKMGYSLSQHALVKRPTNKHVPGMYKMEGSIRIQCRTEEDVFEVRICDFRVVFFFYSVIVGSSSRIFATS